MGFRLLLLMATGLGAMYMMHLLAQDYNRIRQPVQAATRFLSSASATLMRRKREINMENELPEKLNNEGKLSIDWKRILSRDPFECLQSLICQIMSGAENTTNDALVLIDFVESSLSMTPVKISHAFSRGLALRGAPDRCYDEYPFCIYSAKTMFRILRWFSNEASSETFEYN